jgi:hypothetical protein
MSDEATAGERIEIELAAPPKRVYEAIAPRSRGRRGLRGPPGAGSN